MVAPVVLSQQTPAQVKNHGDLHGLWSFTRVVVGLVDSGPQLVVTKSRPRPTSRSVVLYTVRKGGRGQSVCSLSQGYFGVFLIPWTPKLRRFNPKFRGFSQLKPRNITRTYPSQIFNHSLEN